MQPDFLQSYFLLAFIRASSEIKYGAAGQASLANK